MTLDLWLAFVAASAALLVLPGPTVLLVAGNALTGGRRTARFTVPGVMLGDLTAITLSAAGLGAVLATSATLFTLVKLAGAGYLLWLGLKLWRSRPDQSMPALEPSAGMAVPQRTPRALFLQSYAVTALNPKSIIFFVAFVPQFLLPGAPLLPQLLVLVPTFVALAGLNALLFALLAGSLGGRARRPAVRLWLDRLGGSVLIAAAGMMLAWRRTA